MTRISLHVLPILAFVAASWAVPVTFTVDADSQLQTIRGFGGMVYAGNTDDVPDLVNDLGMSIVRFELSGENTAETQITEDGLVDALIAAGCTTFIATPWSSPSQFEKADNWFDTTKSDAWLDWWIGRVKMFRDRHGVELFGASIQNEPQLDPVYYDVTKYNPIDFRHLVRKIGPRLQTEGLSTSVLWSENVMSINWRNSLMAVASDTSAMGGSQYAPYYCVHGYDASGVTGTSANASTWLPVGAITSKYGKEAWLTETSGVTGSSNWEHAINWASFFYSTLKYGQLSVYVHHYVAHPDVVSSHYYFLEGDTKYPWYYAVKSFWRFIRPGAVQLGCFTDNESYASPLAFAHPDNNTLTLVFVNPTGTTLEPTLAGENLPATYNRHLTANGQNCVDMGAVDAGSISLPPSSITTLVATGYEFDKVSVAAPVDRAPATDVKPVLRNEGAALFSLDGRRIHVSASSKCLRTGVYVVKQLGGTGVVGRVAR